MTIIEGEPVLAFVGIPVGYSMSAWNDGQSHHEFVLIVSH